NNIRNNAKVLFAGDKVLAERFGFEAGYENTFFDYQTTGNGSYAALLNRWEHQINFNGTFRFNQDKTTLKLGYAFGVIDYTSGYSLSPAISVPTESRNNYQHIYYVAADHKISD